ncbi:MAG: helix-turn-helix domain-containing protein [Acidobacteria bacterium]|nr:helix-turn-helix domain-containing protein [Acidobacteriota bacterium]
MQDDVLRARQAAKYIGRSLGSLYVLTSRNQIPHFKPRGKVLLFRKCELDSWIEAGRVPTVDDIEAAARR